MRHISIKWRMTLWFTVVMVTISALVLVFVMLMNRNSVTRPPEAQVVYMVQRNADDLEFDHGNWDFSDVEFYGHGVYTEIYDEDGRLLGGWLISSLSFKPMEKVIAAAESISGGDDLSKRIGLPRGKSEINRLAGAFDDMFDRLERSFKAETQFTSDASHELRTPVTVILAECDTLERTQPTAEDYQEGVGVIRRQAQQMSRLIGQLLHITRLEQGTQKTYMERADLSALAEAVCEQQRLIAPAGMELTLDAPEPVEAQADVLLMTRVLNNLIANAFRYGKDGGHVSVTVRRENGWAVLAVRDDGIGIAPEQQERIWQRFYQVDPARSGGEGTGLGLYMVRQSARLHGGTAEVDSAPGQGSTFTVRIPAHRK